MKKEEKEIIRSIKELAPEMVSKEDELRGAFIQKPKALIGRRDINPREQDLLCLVYEFDKSCCFVGNAHLAGIIGVSERQITKMIGKLRERGFLEEQSFYDKKTKKVYRRTLKVSGKIRNVFSGLRTIVPNK